MTTNTSTPTESVTSEPITVPSFAVAIAQDFGERYVDTIYHAEWVQAHYGEDMLSSDEVTGNTWVGSQIHATDTASDRAVLASAS